MMSKLSCVLGLSCLISISMKGTRVFEYFGLYFNGKFLYCSYGSFFGPSEIVVARRVIVETCARNEASCIAPKVSKEDPKVFCITPCFSLFTYLNIF